MIVTPPTNAEGTEGNESTEGKTPEEIEAARVEAERLEAERIAAEGETELVVAIGAEPSLGSEEADDEAPLEDGTPAPQFVKDLRKKARDDARRLRELERERDEAVAAAKGIQQAPAAVVVGDKPTLETCDYKSDVFETELAAWYERKAKADELERGRTEEQRKATDAYTERLTAYKTGAATLKVSDFDASEKSVEAALSKVQQSILIKHAKNSALLVYALGKDAAKLKELGAIKDPVEFAVRTALLETEIKTVSRPKYKPETRVNGGGTGSPATGASALEKARATAEKTGDYTEVNRIKAQAKAAAKKS